MRYREGKTVRASNAPPVLRRPKGRPCDDFWHTLSVGLPIAALLFVTLPILFRLIF